MLMLVRRCTCRKCQPDDYIIIYQTMGSTATIHVYKLIPRWDLGESQTIYQSSSEAARI